MFGLVFIHFDSFICSECCIHTLPFSAEDSINLSHSDDNPDENITTPSEGDPEHFTCFGRKGLHFIHLNVRSLISKISALRYIAVRTNAAVTCLSETWLDDSVSDGEILFDEFCLIRRDRNRTGGGVCMYILSDLCFSQRNDLDSEGRSTFL